MNDDNGLDEIEKPIEKGFVPDPKWVTIPGQNKCYGMSKQDLFIKLTRLNLFVNHTVLGQEEISQLVRLGRTQCFNYRSKLMGLEGWPAWMPPDPIGHIESHWNGWLPVYMRNRNVLPVNLGPYRGDQAFYGEILRIKRDNPMVSSSLHTLAPIRAPTLQEAWFRCAVLIHDHIDRTRLYMENDARLGEFENLWKAIVRFDSCKLIEYVGVAR